MTREGLRFSVAKASRLLLCMLLVGVSGLAAGTDGTPFDHIEWRSVGPVNMSGRVADVEGIPGNPDVVYVGSASGGVWKSSNGGLTFEPIFDDQPVASIGDLALAPTNLDVVYVGTGEANARNSVSFGNGVYRSTDGGGSWTYLGLEDTRHISRVLVSSLDPEVVFVGAMGHFSGPNEERGVFRSTNGGQSWDKVLYLDDRHGVSDMDIDPTNPNILYAALWHFDRKPWTHTTGSTEGGVWRSVDGGSSWKKLEKGLPKGVVGRIGVKVAPSNPNVVYVIAESNEGTLFRSSDRGETFEKVTDEVKIVSRGLYYTDIRVDPVDENRVYAVSSRLMVSIDGGKNFERISRSTHVDFHSLWIDPMNPKRMWQGQDGGVAVTYDRGETWEPIRNLPIAQLYQAFYDTREPFYYVGGGLQDNGTWYGPHRTREPAGILQDDWRMMSFGDAYFVVPHPEIVDLFLSESQGGRILRTDMQTRQQIDVSPQPRRNDGGPVGILEYRFNWNAPIIASTHDPNTVYFAGNVVFKSRDFGDSWEIVSPDLTTDDPEKQGEAGGPAWTENTTAEYHCTIISFAESPLDPNVLWAGTDDGNLQITQNAGGEWVNVVGHISGLTEFSPVSHIEPSRSGAGIAYASFDGHMLDDLKPHLYKTTDFGKSWNRLSTDGIPDTAWIWVVREDPSNSNLLWVGTELGLYASYDAGSTWQRHHLANLPTVSVHDIQIHPRENDLILGTHGRAIWIFDDATPLQQWSDEIQDKSSHLFPVRTAMRFPTRFTRYGMGDKRHKAPNPADGALITYYLKEPLSEEKEASDSKDEGDESEATQDRVAVEILDASGDVIRTLDPDKLGLEAGLNRVNWDLNMDRPSLRKEPDDEFIEFGGGPRGPMVLPGLYRVRLSVDGESQEMPVEVTIDPLIDVSEADLRAQFEAATGLWAMASILGDSLRGLDVLAEQFEARRQTLEKMGRNPSEQVRTQWRFHEKKGQELMRRLAREEGKPFWSQGPQLLDRIDDLFDNIDQQFAAPTAAQMELLEELEIEFAEGVASLNSWLSTDLPEMNRMLEAEGVPAVAVPDAVGQDTM